MPNEGKYLRVNEITKTAVALIVNEIGMQRGKKLSVDSALWEFIQTCRPDITKRAVELTKSRKVDIKSNE